MLFRLPPITIPWHSSIAPSVDRPVVVILPAHNEAVTVGRVIDRTPPQIEGHRVHIVVVDDGSTDDTAARARERGAQVVSHSQNRGLGAAVSSGFLAARSANAAAAVFLDADEEYAPEELAQLVRPIFDGSADYVVGSRFAGRIDRMRRHRRLGNQILTRWVSWMVRLPITDGQSGYRALSASALAAVELEHDYNYAQVLTLDLVAKGFRYQEVPISYRFRSEGRSFVRVVPYLTNVVPACWRVVNRPAYRIPRRSTAGVPVREGWLR